MNTILFTIIILINLLTISSFYFNFNDLNKYLNEEKVSLDSYDEYLSSEENRIIRLRQMYERFRQQNSIAMKDKDLFLIHPNDVYFLIKRITIEWKTVEELLEPNKYALNRLLSNVMSQNSSKFNYTAAVESYDNVMYFYEQDITSSANGFIEYKTSSGEQKVFKSLSNQSFDAFDCYSIGMQSFNNNDYYYGFKWFNEALKRVDNRSKAEVLANIFRNYNESKEKFFEQQKTTQNKQDDQSEDKLNVHGENTLKLELQEASDDLCVGRKLMNISYESKLKCFYLNPTLRPYLRLTRVRVEELYKRPQIVLIHNFLSETEAQELIDYSKPNLQFAYVLDKQNEGVSNSNYLAFETFIDYSTEIYTRINRRFGEISGLNTLNTNNEQMSVVRYSVGGLINIHHDSSSDPDSLIAGRFLNWLTYLDDVEAGGATVFPKYKVSVFPEKYSSIFWFNHKNSGDVDQDMYHTGCPVLYGQKWIAFKGLHNKGQTHDKCSFNKNEFRYLQDVV